jgi:hypothetical protein
MWTAEEDELLKRLVGDSSTVSWCAIARFFPNKKPPQLAGRWDKVINPNLVKGCWTLEEDEQITKFVAEHGDKDWAGLARILPGRTGKQCRERYKNHLDSSVDHSDWSAEEDDKLIQLHSIYGNAWTKISTLFPGRTDNGIKNRWNSTIRKRIERSEHGQPLVMKRGRKPKAPPFDDAVSSPRQVEQVRIPSIGFLPLSDAIRDKMSLIEKIEISSLVQNRLDLQRLLSSA